MPTVFIPPAMRSLTSGLDRVIVEATTVRGAIDALDAQFPGIHDRLYRDDGLKPGLSVAVDGHVSSMGLLQKLQETSEVHFLPAIGGG